MNVSNLIPQIPKEEITPVIAGLLEIIQKQSEEIQMLKDEIARLKGQKPKPKLNTHRIKAGGCKNIFLGVSDRSVMSEK